MLRDSGIENAREEARIIFSELGGIPRHSLLLGECESSDPRVLEALRRRSGREPLQYILGEVSFYRERYRVTPDVLIPRSDTELLVEYAINNIPEGSLFYDLCTGSGAVAISTLAGKESTRAIATDICEATLEVARYNAEQNRVARRVSFMISDALLPPDGILREGRPFAILSNPPYVTDSEYLALEKEIFFEPKRAFVGGVDGGDFYRAITKNYKDIIDPDGFIAYEIGYDQEELIRAVAEANRMSVSILRDLSDNPRVAVLKNR